MLRYFCGYFIKENTNKLLTLLSFRIVISASSLFSAFVLLIVFGLERNVILVTWLLIVPITIIAIILVSHTWTFFVIFNVIIRRVIILRSWPFSQSSILISRWQSCSWIIIRLLVWILSPWRRMISVLRRPMVHYFGQNMKKRIWFKMINFIWTIA
jgi:hypothetical protein